MLSNHTRFNLQDLLKLDTHKTFEPQASMQSLELLLREFVFAMFEAPISLNLYVVEKQPPKIPLEVKNAFFFQVFDLPPRPLRETNVASTIAP